jgi:putative oxidoreductase
MKRIDLGLLIFRIYAGGFMVYLHGWNKILDGMDRWTKLGSSVGALGIHFAPALWGFLSAATEFFGGLCVLVGFKMRWAIPFLLINMFVAIYSQFAQGATFADVSDAAAYFLVYLGLWFTGAGRYSFDGSK